MSDLFPYDQDAERGLLGCVIGWASMTIPEATEYVVAEDFYLPMHQAIYRAATNVFFSGAKVDMISVFAELARLGYKDYSQADVVGVFASDYGSGNWRRYADIVVGMSTRRRLIALSNNAMQQAQDLTLDVNSVLDDYQAKLSTLDVSVVGREPDDIAVEDFLNRDRESVAPWVIHGIIRRSHKIMVVAAEGSGKSWLLRFIAICAAYGISPFRHTKIPQVRTLIVDLENPEDALFDSFETILKQVTSVSPRDETVNRLWYRPGGINLRNRADFAELENVIRVRQPDLICLGPLYAAYENSSKDFGWETATREVQQAFRKLRKRYDFALMIEDHAPQGDSTGKRHMRPYGSSFWLRWPELGLGLEAIDDNENNLYVSRWRGDRIPTDWPKRIYRGDSVGSPWPFLGDWEYQPERKY